jgi:hypothetical protein
MSTSKRIVIADSTQIEAFCQCNRLWHFGHQLHLEPKPTGPTAEGLVSNALMMGSYGHKLLEVYYKTLCVDSNQSHALDAALATPMSPDITLNQKEIALVQQRVREYMCVYVNNDIKPLSPEYVEVGFSEPLYEDDECLYILEGRIDIIGQQQGLNLIVDHKFQMRMKYLYEKSIQFRNYAMVSRLNLLVINYVRLTQSVTPDTYKRRIANFSPGEHEWWKGKLIDIFQDMDIAIQCAAIAKEKGNGPEWEAFSPTWSTCSGKFGYPCYFTQLCEEFANPEVVERKKNVLYQIRKDWKPW